MNEIGPVPPETHDDPSGESGSRATSTGWRKWILAGAIFLASVVLIDQGVRLLFPQYVYGARGTNRDTYRDPAPYVGFTGKPNVDDHNEFGFRGDFLCDSQKANIIFFGGSTGYLGEPPVPVIATEILANELDTEINLINASVVSSNHRQHLHFLLELLPHCKPDAVIVYGGHNELASPVLYDPRPGYPYNFYFNSDTEPAIQWLVRNSSSAYVLDRIGVKTNLYSLTAQKTVRDSVGYGSSEWQLALAEDYIDTMGLFDELTSGITGTTCGEETLVFKVYQPYNLPDEVRLANTNVRKWYEIQDDSLDLFHLSETLTPEFTDAVHLTQDGRQIMGEAIGKWLATRSALQGVLSNCPSTIGESST